MRLDRLRARRRRELLKGLKFGNEVRVIPAPCVGRCEVAPCVVVHQNPVGNATWTGEGAVERKQCPVRKRATSTTRSTEGRRLQADRRLPRRQAHARRDHQDDGGLGLRGLGGAGFPAGRKWRLVAAEPEPRVMAVNIDEGSRARSRTAGTWSATRTVSRRMLVAAWCSGGEIWIYLRDEYAGPADP